MKKIYLNHLGLLNFSEDEARKFYHGILGLDEQYDFDLKPAESELIFGIRRPFRVLVFSKNNFKLEIFIARKAIEFKPAVNHICLNVPNRSDIIRRCKENGLKVVEIERSDKVTVFVNDFAGNIFELKEEKI